MSAALWPARQRALVTVAREDRGRSIADVIDEATRQQPELFADVRSRDADRALFLANVGCELPNDDAANALFFAYLDVYEAGQPIANTPADLVRFAAVLEPFRLDEAGIRAALRAFEALAQRLAGRMADIAAARHEPAPRLQ